MHCVKVIWMSISGKAAEQRGSVISRDGLKKIRPLFNNGFKYRPVYTINKGAERKISSFKWLIIPSVRAL